MYRRFILLFLLLMALLPLPGCGRFQRGASGPEAGLSPPPMPASPLTEMQFSESDSRNRRVQGYSFRMEDGGPIVSFRLADAEAPYRVPVDQAWVEALTGLIGQYGLMGWDGFHGSDSMLLDGTQFSISFTFADGTAVHASGYGRFPENYGDASRAIDAHFLQLLPEDMHGW